MDQPVVFPRASRRDLLRWAGLAGLASVAGVGATALIPGAANALPSITIGSSTFDPVRPPATPLAVRSPYLTTWLAGDMLPGTWPTFWTGAVTAMTGIVRVDNQPYVFMGAPSGGWPLATQISLVTTATRSTYTVTAGPVTLAVAFFSPVDPANLKRQSVPMSYVTVNVAANDGASHHVSVYIDISGEWAHGQNTQQLSWASQVVGSLRAHSCTPTSPTVLAEFNEQASWGTVVWATDNVAGLSWQTGADAAVRAAAANTGALPNTNDTNQPRAINNNWPVFGFNRDLGTVGAGGSGPIVFVIGHARTPAVSYLGTNLDPWWRTYWATWQDMLTWFRDDYPAALAGGTATDNAINAWAHQAAGSGAAGDQYAALCALTLRQAIGGTELVNHNGSPWAMLKEISSNGDFSTVDVIYPASPAYLQLSPYYLELVLAAIFDYVENHGYPKTWAPHDLGTYPNAFGRINAVEEDMPVEESANMLIMATAVIARMPAARATAYAQQHYTLLHQWADYLVANLPDPGNQNQTDDFTGFIAHSVNLALKGIIGIGAMAEVARAAGNTGDVTFYSAKARAYIGQWVSMGQNAGSSHLKLTYDGADTTWSLKYNGYPDRLLDTNLIPPAVTAEEAAWYLQNQHTYGVLLDPRNQYTKTDWELWTAAFLAGHPDARDMLIGKAYAFANGTSTRVPLTDWYDTNSGDRVGFADRPVIGGILALLTLRYAPNGLTGYWPFDGGNALDASGNAGDGTLSGGAVLAAGKLGGAVSLNGGGAFVATPRPVVRTDNSFTVTAWANPSSLAGTRTVARQDGARLSGFYLQYSPPDNRWAFAMTAADADNAGATRALSSAAPTINAWTHLAGVYDAAAGQLRLYVNGVAEGTAAYSAGWQANGSLVIGRAMWNGNPVDFFAGSVDEVRTFDRALSAADVAASFHLTDNLIASYPMDNTSGSTATDVAGGHPLTLTGGAGWAGGYSGNGLNPNGGAATTTGPLVNTGQSFSVSAWANLANLNGFMTVASQDGSQVSGFYLQYSLNDNAWAFSMLATDATSAAPTRALSPFPPKVGDWTHLAGVYDASGAQLRLYVNGVRVSAVAKPAAWNAGGVFAVGRGMWSGAAVDFFAGQIDQVKVWARALSDSDVRALV
jgi:hypothetical protein